MGEGYGKRILLSTGRRMAVPMLTDRRAKCSELLDL